jgi:hypothetical protein
MLNNIVGGKRSGCLGPVGGAIFGALIFLSAFLLIWFNEGRPNLAVVAADSLPVGAGSVDPANEGRFLAVTGRLAARPLGDELFLAPGGYLQIKRTVEMYAWVEKRRGDADNREYSYEQEWTASPESGEQFAQPAGHRNPPLDLPGGSFTASGGRLGAFPVDLATLQLPAAEELQLDRSVLLRGSQEQISGRYLFRGFGTLERPEMGDIRISFSVVPGDREVTAFGAQGDGRLEAYWSEKYDVSLYRALAGGREAAIDQLDTEHTVSGWIMRALSLLMLWGGLALILGPLTAVLAVLPMAIRQAGGCAVGLLTFVPAFALWAVAEAIAIVAHNPWLLAGTVLLAIAAAVVFARRWRPRESVQPGLSA